MALLNCNQNVFVEETRNCGLLTAETVTGNRRTFEATQILAVSFFCMVALSVPAHAADDLARRDWSVKAKLSFEKNPPAQDIIRAFVNKTLNADMNPVLCSYKFIDVASDGVYRLAASLDPAGRHFCNELVVIGKDGSRFTVLNQWKVWQVDNISSVLIDVDHDGRGELVLPQNWAPYEGASHCLATWQTIFQWESGKFVERSSLYPDFYKARRQELKSKLDQNMGYGPDAVCEQMEIDKIDRFLGTELRAGFTRAVDWMKSPDASLRRKAAAVFADIGGSESKDNLKTLSSDPNSLVAETAKMYLEGSR